ncbi:tyrosine-protein phosphatase [Sphingobium sp. Sx8-8]|uniref:tyrosine-protein phosphatase n=1 Tax=Sphingobium sp. Sx8-8 TaxID=2933617 RepID=UPI002479559C|nr:tyrosine-protein phosphatase [Sphingobium sp. Sx8-8]
MLSGVHNFRDAGGYRTAAGTLRRNLLFRSGRLTAATREDEAILGRIDFQTIVDLRRGAERHAFPTGAWAAKCEAISSDVGGHADPWVTFLRSVEPSAAAVRDYILAFYRSVPFEERHIGLFSRYFSALAEGRGPLLVHCSGGKDRTGIVIALTHALLGVPREDMVHDYLLTNRHWNYETHGAAVAEAMREEAGRPVDPAAVRAAIEVEAEYLDAAFDVIAARAGSVARYLDEVVGITGDRQRAIIARLVEHQP